VVGFAESAQGAVLDLINSVGSIDALGATRFHGEEECRFDGHTH
jgi:hypothetical protein